MSSQAANGPIVVLGATGQLGGALARLLGAQGVALPQAAADLASPCLVTQRLDDLQPVAVINTAAYTQVDRAEAETELALRVNGEAPGVLAHWCGLRGIPFVHFSTDYVFPGTGTRPWTEDDPPAPINAYGRSKLEGERRVAAAGGHWLIFRTSWVYDASGRNFLTTMLRLAGERERLSVVDDQVGAPTYAPELAAAALHALQRARALVRFPSGIYHLCHGGETSWYGFASAIFAGARGRGLPLHVKTVGPIATHDYPTPARRPANSRLNTEKVHKVLGASLPPWQAGLARCLEEFAPDRRETT